MRDSPELAAAIERLATFPDQIAALQDELDRLRATVRWQADNYLTRARAELPQGDALRLIETALNHIRDAAGAPTGE